MREVRAFICGCAGLSLTDDERAFLRRYAPWGLILFARNIKDRAQVKAIIDEFREIIGRADAPVLIDQEGGRVQRMRPPEWLRHPAAADYEAAPEGDRAYLVRQGARLIAHELAEVGINVDCMPVLDVPAPGGHDVIGDRAYSADPGFVALLGRAACEGLLDGGVLPVVKHMPGHGRATADSHHALPVVRASLRALETDFSTFQALSDMPLAMTAHVVYAAVDPDRPATLSPKVVAEVIRGEIGFNGLLMSDDLSMKALSGSFAEKTQSLFAAGLDMALYCWADLREAEEVALAAPVLDGARGARAARALARLCPPQPFDAAAARAELAAALPALA